MLGNTGGGRRDNLKRGTDINKIYATTGQGMGKAIILMSPLQSIRNHFFRGKTYPGTVWVKRKTIKQPEN